MNYSKKQWITLTLIIIIILIIIYFTLNRLLCKPEWIKNGSTPSGDIFKANCYFDAQTNNYKLEIDSYSCTCIGQYLPERLWAGEIPSIGTGTDYNIECLNKCKQQFPQDAENISSAEATLIKQCYCDANKCSP
jgi:hypothetical protein